jgi:hypothetical protein
MGIRTQKVTKIGNKGRGSSNNTEQNETTPRDLDVYYLKYHLILETSKKMFMNGINESDGAK